MCPRYSQPLLIRSLAAAEVPRYIHARWSSLDLSTVGPTDASVYQMDRKTENAGLPDRASLWASSSRAVSSRNLATCNWCRCRCQRPKDKDRLSCSSPMCSLSDKDSVCSLLPPSREMDPAWKPPREDYVFDPPCQIQFNERIYYKNCYKIYLSLEQDVRY